MSDYQIIMWQEQTPRAYDELRALGATAGIDEIDRATGRYLPAQLATLSEHELGFYLENIATDFHSLYHRYDEGKPVNWRYLDLKERYRHNRGDLGVFVHEPSLSDPRTLADGEERLAANARALEVYRPLFYDLADEPGIADLAVNWDFDLSKPSLAGMRQWLADQYGSLAALNTEWGTHFAASNDGMAATTDEALEGKYNNFAAWVGTAPRRNTEGSTQPANMSLDNRRLERSISCSVQSLSRRTRRRLVLRPYPYQNVDFGHKSLANAKTTLAAVKGPRSVDR